MKKITLLFTVLLFAVTGILAQTPNQFKYQAVLRNADGTIIADENVTVDISILQGSATGTSVFTESHSETTTAQGLINLNIGSISDLGVINWSTNTYFVEISVNGTTMGTSQLLSVPYAINAKTAENVSLETQNLNDVLTVGTDAGNKKITNLADPTENQDAANKAYVDALESRIIAVEDILFANDLVTITDVEGNIYKTIKIGSQVWMAENLKVTKYADGTTIPTIVDLNSNGSSDDEWEALGYLDKAYCWYDDDINNKDVYGALYTYAATTNSIPYTTVNIQGVCPTGWHIPNNDEWLALINYIANDGHNGAEGTALKATTGWVNWSGVPEGNGTDNYHFSAIAGGYRSYDAAGGGSFEYGGNYGIWWSSTQDGTSAYTFTLSYLVSNASHDGSEGSAGLSVRCIRD